MANHPKEVFLFKLEQINDFVAAHGYAIDKSNLVGMNTKAILLSAIKE